MGKFILGDLETKDN